MTRNEVYGTIKTPKSPEEYTPEESFYNGKAAALGHPSYREWAKADPAAFAGAREEWAKQDDRPYPTFVVPTFDPNTGMSTWTGRDQAIGMPVNPPAGQRDRLADYDRALTLIDDIEALGNKTGWKGLGPIAGTLQSVGMKLGGEKGAKLLGATDPAAEETMRAMIGELTAMASFGEGGKQFTGTEKQMINEFVAAARSHPDQVRTRIPSMRERFMTGRAALGAPGMGPAQRQNQQQQQQQQQQTSPPTGAPPGGDLYEEYLRRRGGK
jgi:hypothetical protein